MNTADISVIVTGCDDADSLGRCLDSVRGFGEIVIVENFGAGGALETARRYPGVIFRRPVTSFVESKNWALSRASRKWALVLDGNESLDETAKQSIADVDEKQADGFRVRRASEYMGKTLRGGPTSRDRPVRLFERTRGRFVETGTAVEVDLDGTEGAIDGTVHRVWYQDVGEQFDAVNRDTTAEAKAYVDRGGRLPVFHMFFRPPVRFLKLYIGQSGFRDGARGFVFCWVSAFATFITYAKAWEFRRNERRRKRARNQATQDIGK